MHQNLRFTPTKKTDFFRVLRQRVDDYFTENQISKHANAQMVTKSIVLIALLFVPFAFVIFGNISFEISLILWSIMGVAAGGIGMSIMHDANHQAYSSKKWVNTLVGYSINLVGGSAFNWTYQHNILHHTYTNICGVDEDIKDKVVLRFSPHTKLKWIHRFQPFYAILFYSLMSIYWATVKDFDQFERYIRKGINQNSKQENLRQFGKLVLSKIFYFSLMLGLPIYFSSLAVYQILLGFMLMHAVTGIILTIIFQMAHTVEGTDYPLPNPSGVVENDWAMHQLATTVNFCPGNKLLSWYVGGLNYQVEHHLFTRICHIHYPQIAPIVKQTCAEYGVPYLENKTFFEAFNAHLKALKRFGGLPSLDTAIG